MKRNKYYEEITAHYASNWGNSFSEQRWNRGPVHDMDKNFHILEFEPTETHNMWTYATCGMSAFSDSHPVELHLYSKIEMKLFKYQNLIQIFDSNLAFDIII